MSWADEIHSAQAGEARAKIYLSRAQGQGSKRKIEGSIQSALDELGGSDVNDLLVKYALPYTMEGLLSAAELLAADITQ